MWIYIYFIINSYVHMNKLLKLNENFISIIVHDTFEMKLYIRAIKINQIKLWYFCFKLEWLLYDSSNVYKILEFMLLNG